MTWGAIAASSMVRMPERRGSMAAFGLISTIAGEISGCVLSGCIIASLPSIANCFLELRLLITDQFEKPALASSGDIDG
jgi:hypothetical protein